jgi:TatD DNase family protein
MTHSRIFDTHCHYNLSPLKDDWKNYWQKAKENGVQKSIVVGTDWQSIQDAIDIAATDPDLYAAVGLHPNEFDQLIMKSASTLTQFHALKQEIETQNWTEKMQFSQKKVVAIGETGLDYFHLAQDETLSEEQKKWVRELQQLAFRKHISLAQEHQLSLIIHVRDKGPDAYSDVLRILHETNYTGRFNLHCISGSMSYVQEALQMGAYIGVAGNVTYKNAENIRDLVRSVPADRILLETDAPFLPPQEFRGHMCEPWMISKTALFLEQELSIDLEQVWQNSFTYFKLEE